MKVSGFTIVRNAIKYDYPIVESISSVLPLCDEFIVAVGKSEDDTLELIRNIKSEKIKIIETVWDDTLRVGGRTFALETDKALQALSSDTNWCFYIQADEVLHEKYIDRVRDAMILYQDNKQVDGLLFEYKHFYGSYDYVGESWRWYRREIRVVRKDNSIFSYKDAQGFRKVPNQKLLVKLINATIYHYGWVKNPRTMQNKIEAWNRFYRDDAAIEQQVAKQDEFDFSQVDSLTLFEEEHPAVMANRIQRKNWTFDYDLSLRRYSAKEKVKRLVSMILGYRIGEYKNYKIVR